MATAPHGNFVVRSIGILSVYPVALHSTSPCTTSSAKVVSSSRRDETCNTSGDNPGSPPKPPASKQHRHLKSAAVELGAPRHGPCYMEAA